MLLCAATPTPTSDASSGTHSDASSGTYSGTYSSTYPGESFCANSAQRFGVIIYNIQGRFAAARFGGPPLRS